VIVTSNLLPSRWFNHRASSSPSKLDFAAHLTTSSASAFRFFCMYAVRLRLKSWLPARFFWVHASLQHLRLREPKNIRLQFGQRFTRYRSGEVSRVTSNRAASICGLAMGGRKTILAGLRKIASIQIPTSDCLQKASSSRLPITHEDP